VVSASSTAFSRPFSDSWTARGARSIGGQFVIAGIIASASTFRKKMSVVSQIRQLDPVSPTANQLGPGLALTGPPPISLFPFISQIETWPVLVFCHEMSEWPSLLKSPVPTANQRKFVHTA
jgi:hypothetical protein